MEEQKRTKKTKAIYVNISNEIGRSCKTIKCNKEMNIRLEFTQGRSGGLNQLSMKFRNNFDGTSTLLIRGSRDIKIKDERE
jgi:hypothetical protein